MAEFKEKQTVKPSPAGISQAGLSTDLRGQVRGMANDGKVLVLLDKRVRAFPAAWFEAVSGDETKPKPVSERHDKCRFGAGEIVRFMGYAYGFEGKEHTGKVLVVVPPKSNPFEVLKAVSESFDQTHTFRLDRKHVETAVRTHRYWIEATPTDSRKAKPALFLKTNQWVRKQARAEG